jgi:uncharacterized protein (DUF885 family)
VTASEDLRQLAEDYWEGLLQRDPLIATFYGDYRYNDRLPDVGPDGRRAEEGLLSATRARLEPLLSAELEDEDRITADMLKLSVDFGLEALRLRLDEMAVDQMQGPQVWLPELLNWHPTDTPEHVEQLIARYRAFDAHMDQYMGNLEDGVRDGRTAPEIAVERVLAQLRDLLAQPVEGSPLVTRANVDQSELGAQLRHSVAETVYPAFTRMHDYLGGYLERHARRDPGVWSVTDGAEIYALLARQHTTTDLTPDELHQIGLDDLVGIHAEMRQIMAREDQPDTSIRAFTERITRDPANLPNSREEIVERSEHLLDAAEAALSRAFGRLPRTPCLVKPIEEFRERDAPAAFYYQPSEDSSRPGTFYVNTFEPSSRPLHTLPALAFHEGVPGHHLQIALAQETRDLPRFRRLGAGWLASAFVEGWALYTERLADELGLYPDERARFGMLGYQAWRACRLVVDTGIHHLRWTRARAIEFFFDNVGLTERETVNEVDRYIVWPGQALAYKIGQRQIEVLRADLQRQLGERFDVRAFHDELLGHAGVPLSTLDVMRSALTR